MAQRKSWIGQTSVIALLGWLALAWSAYAQPQTMRVHVIDVGQGASTLVEFPCAAILIDTGGESNEEFNSTDALKKYLDDFFRRRSDLNKTFQSLILSHPHIDHTRGVKAVLANYKIRNAITNGSEEGSGGPGQRALHEKVADSEAAGDPQGTIGFFAATVKKIPKGRGLTNDVIDPVKCDTVDPKITVLWGASETDPGWTSGAFDNANNHSVVTRIDFGAASLLITGDLQEDAIDSLIEHYQGSKLLDTDVYQVGHHGSHNGTTEELLRAITPKIAVMAMGPSSRELNWTAWKYGHPRKKTVELLEANVEQSRDAAITAPIAVGATDFERKRIKEAIYATGWDGTVILEVDTGGSWKRLRRVPTPVPEGFVAADSSLVSINTASVEQLAALPRIGPERARAIVDFRTANGRFQSVEDLGKVPGVGPATVITLKKLVTTR